MSDFAAARRNMVDGQLRTNDVTDLRVLGAFLAVPRERFVPAAFTSVAYLDLDVPVTDGNSPRRMLTPMLLGKLIQTAAISDSERVLDVGCATGYSAAVLSRIAEQVVALEENPALAAQARERLANDSNVTVETGALTKGWAQAAPYDVILVNGAVEVDPVELCTQLSPGGRLLCVKGRGPGGKATIYQHSGAQAAGRSVFEASAAVLPGFERPQAFVF
ncbi:MAG: protein-L-isoaspartate O-methyltransferase [Xanthobacteraceae bacterium]|uniref:protein-L-isoaspartate O-methyltransferase family protein n=1 Tax=Pseudolabrys sp. TaxID=1960880 RepID=UPI003D0E1270